MPSCSGSNTSPEISFFTVLSMSTVSDAVGVAEKNALPDVHESFDDERAKAGRRRLRDLVFLNVLVNRLHDATSLVFGTSRERVTRRLAAAPRMMIVGLRSDGSTAAGIDARFHLHHPATQEFEQHSKSFPVWHGASTGPHEHAHTFPFCLQLAPPQHARPLFEGPHLS
jgi:hypothetical protein